MIELKNLNPKFITNEAGEKISVVLTMAKFQKLLEDIEDLAAIAERREKPSIPHDESIKKLKQDGILQIE